MRWGCQIIKQVVAQYMRCARTITVQCNMKLYLIVLHSPPSDFILPKLLVPSSSKENPNFSQCLFLASLCDKLFFIVIPLFSAPLSSRLGCDLLTD